MWTSTNSPPDAGGENFPKSTYPADGLSAPTPTLAKADRTARASVSRMTCFIIIPGVNVFGFIGGMLSPAPRNTRKRTHKLQRKFIRWRPDAFPATFRFSHA